MPLPQWAGCKWTTRKMHSQMLAWEIWMVEWTSTKDLENQCLKRKVMITQRKRCNNWHRLNKKTKTGRKCFTRKCRRSLRRRGNGKQLRSRNFKSGKTIGTLKLKERSKLISRKQNLSNRKWSNPRQERILGLESLIIVR